VSNSISKAIKMYGSPFKRWMKKHFAMAPKGYLRFYILRLLGEKPMSGSEIMDEVEKRTEGSWKPSPGSVYPLITWLNEKGYAKEVSKKEAGIKRYALTDQGKALLTEHLERFKACRPLWFSPFGPRWAEAYPEMAEGFYEATRQLGVAIWRFRESLRKKYLKKAVVDAKNILEQAAKELDEASKKLEKD